MTETIHKGKIFADTSSLEEIAEIKALLGYLDGVTTNPSNFVKTLMDGTERVYDQDELLELYKKRIQEIRSILPTGSISVEVYADHKTSAEEMIVQAEEMNTWIEGAHIKLPTIPAGLVAAKELVGKGMNVNLTLVFTEQQAAAVYVATIGARRGQVYISPFIGRLDDTGMRGLDLVKNLVQLYQKGDSHVEILAASIRTGTQLAAAISAGADIVTSYPAAIKEWVGLSSSDLQSKTEDGLKSIPYEDTPLHQSFSVYNISHPLVDSGLKRFADDWRGLIKS